MQLYLACDTDLLDDTNRIIRYVGDQSGPLPSYSYKRTHSHNDRVIRPYFREGRAASRKKESYPCTHPPCTRPREIVHVEQTRVEAANAIFGPKLCCALIQPGIALLQPHIHCPRMCRGHSRRSSWPWCMHSSRCCVLSCTPRVTYCRLIISYLPHIRIGRAARPCS